MVTSVDRYALSAQERPQVVRVDIAGGEGAQYNTEVKAHRCEGAVPGQYYVGVGDVGRFLTVLLDLIQQGDKPRPEMQVGGSPYPCRCSSKKPNTFRQPSMACSGR